MILFLFRDGSQNSCPRVNKLRFTITITITQEMQCFYIITDLLFAKIYHRAQYKVKAMGNIDNRRNWRYSSAHFCVVLLSLQQLSVKIQI